MILSVIAFTNKSLSSAETRYRNIESEVLGILLGLEKFHHYCFAHEVNTIIHHKLLVTTFIKDVAVLSQ